MWQNLAFVLLTSNANAQKMGSVFFKVELADAGPPHEAHGEVFSYFFLGICCGDDMRRGQKLKKL